MTTPLKFWIRSLRVAICAVIVGGLLVAVALIFWIAPAFDRLYEWCAARYERGLRFCLGRRLLVLAVVLLCLPLGYKSYRDQARALDAAAPAGGEVPSPPSAPTMASLSEPPHDDDRPGRLH